MPRRPALKKDSRKGLAKGRVIGRAEGLEEGLAKGLAKGRAEGREEGREEERNSIVLKMLKNNLPVQTICDVTGLSVEEVAKLKENL